MFQHDQSTIKNKVLTWNRDLTIGGLEDWKIGRVGEWRSGGVERHQLRIRYGRSLAPTLLFGNPIHALFENMVRTKSCGAMLLGNFSAYHENTVRTNSRRVQKTQKRRKGLRLSRPFRPLPLIRGSVLPNVTCKVQAPLQDAPFYILHFTFYTLPARRWAFAAPTAILSLYLSLFLSFLFICNMTDSYTIFHRQIRERHPIHRQAM